MQYENQQRLFCERQFMEGGPFFHLATKPLQNDLLFRNNEEMDEALNMLSLSALEAKCQVLAFSIMSNHFHFILEGPREDCEEFYRRYRNRIAKWLSKSRKLDISEACEPGFTAITSLKQLRDEIAYVVRNPFVARQNVNVFSYRWSSGFLYFNGMMDWIMTGDQVCKYPYDKRRTFRHERNADIDPRLFAIDGVAHPSCFVNWKRTMSFFENARQYIQCVMKNVESQISIAQRLGEAFRLDDSEVWSVAMRLCRETYKTNQLRELSVSDKVELASTLKYNYKVDNAQLARCLGFSRVDIDQLFPLSSQL